MANEVEGMDVKVAQSITLRIGTCEIVQVVVDKMLFAESFPQKLYGRGIAFL